ncbi:hypothetical protein AB1E18_011327 [Capra hircus]
MSSPNVTEPHPSSFLLLQEHIQSMCVCVCLNVYLQ